MKLSEWDLALREIYSDRAVATLAETRNPLREHLPMRKPSA